MAWEAVVVKGRRPKPPGQRLGHRADPHPVLVGGRPDIEEFAEPPESLPEDAKRFWHEHVPYLASAGLLDRVDTAALEMVATAYARFWQANRVLEEDGLFVEGSRGQTKPHPAVRIEADARDAFIRGCESFGLSPLARVRLGLAELSRRTLSAELADKLGPLRLEVVEGTAEDD